MLILDSLISNSCCALQSTLRHVLLALHAVNCSLHVDMQVELMTVNLCGISAWAFQLQQAWLAKDDLLLTAKHMTKSQEMESGHHQRGL